MKKSTKRFIWIITAFMLFFMHFVTSVKAEKSLGKGGMPFRDLTAEELTKEMGAGWNLGNTMDGHTGFTPNEMVWQNVKTTKQLIRSIHDMGFNTVRIPVTWGTKIEDESFTIEESWISRVQDIVDYCVSLDMYAIINIHHDGAEQTGWLRIASEDLDFVKEKYEGVWRTIADRFKDYDEHLIFESMNEVKGKSMTVAQENKVICDLNQIFVNVVRETGSNNTKRWLVITGKYNFIDSVSNPANEFTMPKDSADGRLIVSVHDYSPWNFCGLEKTDSAEATLEMMQRNKKELQPMYEQYTSKQIPVIVGEYGCINKDNTEDRAYYLEAMNRIYRQYNLIGIYWDQGWYDRTRTPDYSFTIVDRTTGQSVDKEVTDAMMRGFFTDGAEDLSDISKKTKVKEFTTLEVKEPRLELYVGEQKEIQVTAEPFESNDVILYRTSDETVATVTYGKIRAKGAGTARVTVFAQSGNVKQEIEVVVSHKAGQNPCKELTLNSQELNLQIGEYLYIESGMVPADTDEFLYYRSGDEKVATVSPIGKILAVGQGKAVITVSTSGGIQKEITVNVGNTEFIREIQLALNVYYNDGTNNYYSNEEGSRVITVTEDGKYTLSFDCDTELSDAARAAGVTSLERLTAIYIKDHAVTKGLAETSPLESCDISYDSIVVDGIPLTIIRTESKSALKSSGIFDTNDPINFWDGSVVEEVSSNGFSTMKNPKKIEVTFTLSNLVFIGQEKSGEDKDQIPVKTEIQEETEDSEEVKKASEKGVRLPEEKSSTHIEVIILAVIGLGTVAGIIYTIVRKRKS